MNYDRYLKAEWKDNQREGTYLHAYNGKDVDLKNIPTVLVGIGGSGIKAVLSVKDKVESLYHPDNAAKLEYLLIDTDDVVCDDKVKKEDTIVIQSADTAMLLHERKTNSDLIPDEIKSWLDTEISPFNVMNGAAGIRQAGRLILFLNIQRVYNTLRKKIEKVSVGYDLSKVRVQAYLFTGIGGGTGSGMFVDISYLLRHICPNIELNGIIIMPDVSCKKPGLRDVTKSNIKRNGFAALKEIEYLMMLERYSERFVQKYPGNIGTVNTNAPIFDYCFLVGAQEKGRKSLCSEDEIYHRVAEYMLSELQQKYGFGAESFRSNLVYGAKATECFFEKYVSLGADSKYIAVDYYYSRWLYDVISDLQQEVLKTSVPDFGNEQKIKKEVDEMLKWLEKTYEKKGKRLKKKGVAQGNALSEIKKDLRPVLEDSAKNCKYMFENVETVLYFMKDESAIEKIKDYFNNCSQEYRKGRFLKKRKARAKGLLLDAYIDNFMEVYDSVFQEFQQPCTEFYGLICKIKEKCSEYEDLKLDKCYLSSEHYFNSIKKTDAYILSKERAVKLLSEDFMKNGHRWLGRTNSDERFIWLSDYIAELLNTEFERSGCKSVFTLMEEYDDGNQMKMKHIIEEIYDELDKTNQLWPTVGTDIKEYNMYEALLIPDNNELINLAKTWKLNSNSQVAVYNTRLLERFSKIVFVTGYAMWSFSGLKEFEEEYIHAQNKVGLHLYATNEKKWKYLPSPYFETKWTEEDKMIREEEKNRNDEYRNVFKNALSADIIYYDPDIQAYCFREDTDGNILIKNEIGRVIRIGDIELGESENEQKLAADMFIHMFSHRDRVKKALDLIVKIK